MVKNNPIFAMPLGDLALSEEFLAMARANNFTNLSDITEVPVYKLLKLPKFGYRVLFELMRFLKKNNVESALIDD